MGSNKKIHIELSRAISKIEMAPIIYDPFPRIEVSNLFSDEFYDGLMKELPPKQLYARMAYAGTAPHYKLIDLSEPLNPTSSVGIPLECCKTKRGCANKCFYDKRQLHNPGST